MFELSHSSSILKVGWTSGIADMATADETYVAVGIKCGLYSVPSSEWPENSAVELCRCDVTDCNDGELKALDDLGNEFSS